MSKQHSSSFSIDVTPVSSEAQDDCSAWSAQIAIQPGDKPNTLSASANASSFFINSRTFCIGGNYSEYCGDRQISWRCPMSHALLDCGAIDVQPERYLRSVGAVFAEFGAMTQDSGNISYGVQIAAERYFIKTAGRPDDPRPFLNHPARVALLRNAIRLSESFRHPTLPKLYRVIESPSGPLLVYQLLTPSRTNHGWNLTGDKSNRRIRDSLSIRPIFWERAGIRALTL